MREALSALDGSLVVYLHTEAGPRWTFKHPTIADALGAVIAQNLSSLDIYLSGTRLERLLEEVTCGNVGLEGSGYRA